MKTHKSWQNTENNQLSIIKILAKEYKILGENQHIFKN